MSARKEAEVQYNATVTERTRIAQELHDTLLRGFTDWAEAEALTHGLLVSLVDEKEPEENAEQSDDTG